MPSTSPDPELGAARGWTARPAGASRAATLTTASRRPTGAPPSGGAAVARAATLLMAAALVAVDVLLLLANLAHLRVDEPGDGTPAVFSDGAWNGGLDGSAIEMWGHLQLVLAVVALVSLAVARRAVVYGAWAVVVTALIVDDLLILHETFAVWLVGTTEVPAVAGLRPLDLGEMTAWALAAAVLVPPLLVTHVRARGVDRRRSRTLGALVVALAVFAVVVDMLHVALQVHVPLIVATGMTLLETAGELGVMTAVAVAVFGMAARSGPAGPDRTLADRSRPEPTGW